MRKEIFVVAGVGIVLGLIFAFGIYRVNLTLPKNKIESATPSPGPGASEIKITLDRPEPNDVVTTDSVSISGITKGLANVIVSGENGDYITQADEKGLFGEEVELIPGVNQIVITAFDSRGEKAQTSVNVVYSSAFEIKTFLPSDQKDASSENDIRDKVAQKVAEALNKPKAFLGTVTDIADSTIQIKSDKSQIEQISLSEEEIAVVNSTGTTDKVVKLTDIAIGDFIVAMGYINTNSVLSAQRILITSQVKTPSLNIYMASINSVTSKNLGAKNIPSEETKTLTPGKTTDMLDFIAGGKLTTLKLGSFSENDVVIFIEDASSSTPTLRTVFRIARSQG